MKWRPDPLNCAYVANSQPASVGNFGFVSLYNNDNLGRLFAVMDIGKINTTNTFAGYQVQNKQVGGSAVAASPLVTNQGVPTGQATIGTAAALPTLNMAHAMGAVIPAWYHDFPAIVLAPGWSLSAWVDAANSALAVGFMYEIVDMATLMNAYPTPELKIPKVITLTVETE